MAKITVKYTLALLLFVTVCVSLLLWKGSLKGEVGYLEYCAIFQILIPSLQKHVFVANQLHFKIISNKYMYNYILYIL